MAGSFTDSGLTGLNQTINALFKKGIAGGQSLPWNLLASDLGKSSAAVRAFDWIGGVGEVHERTREGQHFGGFRRHNFTVEHKEYGIGVVVRVRDLATDQLQQIPSAVAQAAEKMATHPGRLLFDALEANPTASDGAALFANTHTYGGAANWDNLLGGTGVTTAAIETDLATAQETMFLAENDAGEPMELELDTIVIPPALRLVFEKVLGPLRGGSGVDGQVGNVAQLGGVFNAGGLNIIVSGRLTDRNNWYGFHTKGEVKPFIYSWITSPTKLGEPTMGDDSVKQRGEFEHVWYGDYTIVPTIPQYSLSVVN